MLKKHFLIVLFLTQIHNVFAQHEILEGSVVDSLTKEPLMLIDVRLSNDKDTFYAKTNFDGNFIFYISKPNFYLLHISNIGYSEIDTIINISKSQKINIEMSDTLKDIEIIFPSREKAKEDINKGEITLFLPGGFVGSPLYPEDSVFEEKYLVKFISYGCVRIGDYEAYNKVIFDYLDKKYGEIWRNEIRKDVIGLK